MTTPQNPGVRRKQKARRSKQLAQWRAKNEIAGDSENKSKDAATAPKTA
jgi:hypothetical protein